MTTTTRNRTVESDPADPPHLESWRPCRRQTHTGVIAPMWDTDPDGPTGWTGWCGIPTDDPSGLCAGHRQLDGAL